MKNFIVCFRTNTTEFIKEPTPDDDGEFAVVSGSIYDNDLCRQPWQRGNRQSFEEAREYAWRLFRDRNRLSKDLDLLERSSNVSGMSRRDFFRLQVQYCHAKIRISRRWSDDGSAAEVEARGLMHRDHYLWAYRATWKSGSQ